MRKSEKNYITIIGAICKPTKNGIKQIVQHYAKTMTQRQRGASHDLRYNTKLKNLKSKFFLNVLIKTTRGQLKLEAFV